MNGRTETLFRLVDAWCFDFLSISASLCYRTARIHSRNRESTGIPYAEKYRTGKVVKETVFSASIRLGMGHWRSFSLGIALVGMALLSGYLVVKGQVNSQLRDISVNQFNEILAPHGYQATIGRAEFSDGVGFILRDLVIVSRDDDSAEDHQPAQNDSLVVDEVILRTDARIGDLLLKNFAIKQVIVDGGELKLVRNSNGQWLIAQLVEGLRQTRPKGEFQLLPIELRQCSVVLEQSTSPADSNQANPKTIRFANVDADLRPVPTAIATAADQSELDESLPLAELADIWQFRLASVNGDNQARVDVLFNLLNRSWHAEFEGDSLAFDRMWIEMLIPRLSHQVERIDSVKGLLSFNGWAVSTADQPTPEFEVAGSIRDGKLVDRQLAQSIDGVSCKFKLDQNAIAIWEGRAASGLGEARYEYSQRGFPAAQSWQLQGRLQDVNLEPGLRKLLPPSGQKMWDDFQPTGRLHLDFRLGANSTGPFRPFANATLLDVSFAHRAFPFRFQSCTGSVTLESEVCHIQVDALEQGVPIAIRGKLFQPGPQGIGHVELNLAQPIAITRKVLESLAPFPNTSQIVQDFNPTGSLTAYARLEKNSAAEKPEISYRIDVHDATVRYRYFDYPFQQVSGSFDYAKGVCQFRDFSALSGNGRITCAGQFTDADGLQLRFDARSVPLDSQLKSALPRQQQAVWEDLKPAGVLDRIELVLTRRPGMRLPKFWADITMLPGTEHNVAAEPTWFPYAVEKLQGNITWDDGQLTVAQLAGRHGRAWFSCSGDGQFSDTQWGVRIQNLQAVALPVDAELLHALPSQLAVALESVEFNGRINVAGGLEFSGDFAPTAAPSNNVALRVLSEADLSAGKISTTPGLNANWHQGDTRSAYRNPILRTSHRVADQDFPLDASWNLRIDTADGNLNIGVPLEHVAGTLNLLGRYRNEQLACRGDMDLESMLVNGFHVSQLAGPVWVDNNRMAVGASAFEDSSGQLAGSLIGRLFGGTLRLDAEMRHTDQYPFRVHATLTDGDLDQAIAEFGVTDRQISGRGFASISFHGNSSGYHTLRGSGAVRLRQARIEVPVLEKLGEMLRVKNLASTVFDEGNADFGIHGEDLDVDRMELIGNAISLVGNGKMNLEKEIDLNFYTVAGRIRNEIPLISDLLKAGSQQILWIKVDGTVDEPQTSKEVMPALNESLRTLLADLEALRTRAGQIR